MDRNGKKILVFGATGNQGGAVARHLLGDGWEVLAVTRNPESEAALALKNAGAELVQADMDDPASLDDAMKGVYGVFSVQNSWVVGVEQEVVQGNAVADAASRAGVQHFVYTSVGGADRKTGIPHFDSKWEVEEHIASLGLPASIVRPVFFMDNLYGPMGPTNEDGTLVLRMAMPPETKLQMIAVDDIGAFVAIMFNDPEKYIGKAIEIAGDELTIPRAAELIGEAAGLPTRFEELPIEGVRAWSEDAAIMFEWFVSNGYEAGITALREIYPSLHDYRTWAQSSPVWKQNAEVASNGSEA